MKIRKRNGTEVDFNIEKIVRAISKANETVSPEQRLSEDAIRAIAEEIKEDCYKVGGVPTVEGVQNMVVLKIHEAGAHHVGINYTNYRYGREMLRRRNTTDARILALLDRNSEDAKQENSNKNPVVNSTQRDYMAGEVSRDLTSRLLLPEDVVRAHEEGILHFHDTDYFAQHMHNCDLVDLDDMLQNGTVITGTLIEKPHRFATACNIATQIIAQVASNQ